MLKVILLASLVLLASCTLNAYDHSAHTGEGSLEPDTSSAEPDTTVTRRVLAGGTGAVITEKTRNWVRYTLKGCVVETDGVAMEFSPVVIHGVSGEVIESSSFQFSFMLRYQEYMFMSETLNQETLLPVVTGTRLLSVRADETTIPFLVEEADLFHSSWNPGGTISCTAVFPAGEWEMGIVCMADEIVVLSENPEYRLLIGDTERRLLEQFYDIFIIHQGEAPVLPVRGDTQNSI